MKKIALIIHSLQTGGMERVMSELAGYFCGKPQYEVHLILYGIKPEIVYPVPQNLIIHRPDWEFNNKKRTWNTIKRIIYLRRIVKSIEPATILSFGEYWNNFVLLATLGTKIPVFISDRCRPDKSLGTIHDFLRSWLYPKAKGVIAQTELAKSIYPSFFKNDNIKVIGNPVRKFKSENQMNRENIILSVGRLIKTKHHDELIKIFAKINPSNWKLIIVGEDAIRQQNKSSLQALIHTLKMDGKIILAGQRHDVEKFYLRSKIFAFTSSSEGFPNVIGEALSAGLPVIAFDCIAGPSDMIKHQVNGLLVPVFDFDAFEKGLKNLIEDDSLRNRFASVASESVSQFSVDTIGDNYYRFMLK